MADTRAGKRFQGTLGQRCASTNRLDPPRNCPCLSTRSAYPGYPDPSAYPGHPDPFSYPDYPDTPSMHYPDTDDIVVGAGILGLATAWHLHRRGRTVRVLERSARIEGASVRNFGMIWPIGQEAGAALRLALRSRDLWLAMLKTVGLWHAGEGSLHVLYHQLEEDVARQFLADASDVGYAARWMPPDEVLVRVPRLRRQGLRGGIYSTTEIGVDPRLSLGGLQSWLQAQGVVFHWESAVLAVSAGRVCTGSAAFAAREVWLCTGHDRSGPFATHLQSAGIEACKLQMMRTTPLPAGERVGAMLAAGLTLARYRSFAACPAQEQLRASLNERFPGYLEHGIHVLVSQMPDGALTIGDSHAYGAAIDPDSHAVIDRMILDYLDRFLDRSGTTIASRWIGIYAGHAAQPWVVLHPEPRSHIVTGVGGSGMTLAFGLTEAVVAEVLGSH